jgi:hypothetical protein
MATIIKTTFKLKRGLLMRWEETNPILAAGEPGWASDAGVLKIGDGSHPWTELPALTGVDLNEEDIQNAVNRYFEKHPIKIVTDTTLSVAGKAADAAAVRELCIMHDDEVILFGGKSAN